jgi:two-component system, OmpR family, sensor kinase
LTVSIRVRLALWYGVMAAIAVLVVATVAYAAHSRAHYTDLDRSLVEEAEHVRQTLAAFEHDLTSAANPLPASRSEIQLRIYGADGAPLPASPPASPPPPIDAQTTLQNDHGPASGAVTRWLPGSRIDAGVGAFATVRDPGSGDRIRVYALPATFSDAESGYIQTWSSLAPLDRAIFGFQLLMLGLAAGGIFAIGLGSMAVAGRALSPISTLTRSARAIAASRGFSRRVPEPRHQQDELGRLAVTFNEMLQSLEDAYRLQQRFVADAAHELRAPLTAIQGNIQLLPRLGEMPEEDRAETIHFLDEEARRLSRLIVELLSLARADAGIELELRPIELDAVLLDTIGEFRLAAAEHQLVVESVEPLTIAGDPSRLKELAIILLDNAIKYTPEGGAVHVSARREYSDALLEVADTGIGIPSEALPHVFERFYRADVERRRDTGGTGLGLSIAKWIVDQHHGEITVDSIESEGTRVVVRLPLLSAARALPAGATAPD